LGKKSVRLLVFLAIVLLTIAGRYYPAVGSFPAVASPFVFVGSLCGQVNAGTLMFSAGMVLPLLALAVCLLYKRFLCRYVCPLGFCLSCVRSCVRRKPKSSGDSKKSRRRSFPKLGIVIALTTWLGCLISSASFLWLDPFVLFQSGFLTDMTFDYRYGTLLAFLLFPVVFLLVMEIIQPAFWCGKICPLGGTQDLCALPLQLTAHKSTNNLSEEIIKERRRELLLTVFVLGLPVINTVFYSPLLRPERKRFVAFRPPGAQDEPLFPALCTRCNSCVQHCPTKLLQRVNLSGGTYGTPVAVFTREDGTLSYCEKECRKCSEVCPSGAIRNFSLEEKERYKIGTAVFDFPNCLLYEDSECTICGRECPYEAIKYVWSEEEYRKVVVVDKKICNGCGKCAAVCPVCKKSGTDEKSKPLRIVSY